MTAITARSAGTFHPFEPEGKPEDARIRRTASEGASEPILEVVGRRCACGLGRDVWRLLPGDGDAVLEIGEQVPRGLVPRLDLEDHPEDPGRASHIALRGPEARMRQRGERSLRLGAHGTSKNKTAPPREAKGPRIPNPVP
jgi:hypothetical protein